MIVGGLECNETAIERFWSHVTVTDGCWEWDYVDGTGYGRLRLGGQGYRRVGAHVFSYHLHHGDHAQEVIDHLCRNTRCVNPDHLVATTYRENTLRGISPTAVAHTTDTCHRGHDLREAYVSKSGLRHCRVCHRERQREYAARKKDQWAS